MMTLSDYIAIAGIYGCVILLVRALFYMVTAYNTITRCSFWGWSLTLLSGIIYLSLLAKSGNADSTSVFLVIFLSGASVAFMKLTKIKSDKAFMLPDIVSKALSQINSSTVRKFDYNRVGATDITFSTLGLIPFLKTQWVNGIAIIRYPTDYNGLFFGTVFPPFKAMAEQLHSDCIEYCYVIQGEMIDEITGEVYKVGEEAVWQAGKIHRPKNNTNEKLIVHVYFKEI